MTTSKMEAVTKESVDVDLAFATASSLHIGSNDFVRKEESKAYVVQLPKIRHEGLYKKLSLSAEQTSPELQPPFPKSCAFPTTISTNLQPDGVPGFPDFPAFWTGEEGGAHTRKRLAKQIKKGKEKRLHRIQKRIMRRAVNNFIIATSKSKEQKRIKRVERKLKKKMSKAQMEQKRKRRADMKEMRKSLASLSFK